MRRLIVEATPPLDVAAIRNRAEAYERHDQYAVLSTHNLRASRALAGTLLGHYGKMIKASGVFTTGLLLRNDPADSYFDNGVWLFDSLEISTVVQDYERKSFRPSELGQNSNVFPLRIEAWQVASPGAKMPEDEDWRHYDEQVERHTLTASIRPIRDTFNAPNMDDHRWDLMPYRERCAQVKHLAPYFATGSPPELADQMEAGAILENHETFARMMGELTVPLAAFAKTSDLRAHWQ